MATEAIRRIRQVFSVEGADAVVAANQRVAQSQQGIAATSTSTERATLSLDRQFASIERRYNATVRAQQDFERVQRQVNAAVAQNPALTQRAALVLDEVNKRYQAQVAAARGAASANDNVAKSTGLARYEMVNLSRQVQDIGVSLAGGQSPFTVLVQQGSQVGDIFANTTGTMRGFASQIAAMITPMRLLAGGVLAIGAAAYAGFSYWKSYALALDDLARSTGTATRDLSALQSAASVKGIGQDDFAAGIKSFSQAVYEAKAGTNELYKLFRQNGQAVGDTATSLERVADLVMRARDDEQRRYILQQAGLPATMEWVRLMRDGADGLRRAKEEAAKFGGAVNDEMVAKAREFDEAWNRAWTTFGVSARSSVVSASGWIDTLIEKGRKAIAAFDRATGGKGLRTVGENLLKGGFGTSFGPGSDLYGGFNWPGSKDASTTRDATDLAAQQRAMQLEQQRISILGELATVSDRVRQKEIEIAQARINGVSITEAERAKLLELTRAQEEYSRANDRLGALGSAATDAERYAVTIQGLLLKLKEGRINQEDFNRAAREASPVFQTLRDSAVSFTQDLVSGLIQGKSLMESLGSSATKLGGSLLNSGIGNLASGNFVTGGVQTVIGGVLSLFGANQQKKQQEQQAQQQAAQQVAQALAQAQQAWAGMAQDFAAFVKDMASGSSGSLTSAIAQARKQMEQFANAAHAAKDSAGVAAANAAFNAGVVRMVQEFRDSFSGAEMSDVQRSLKEFNDKANDLASVLMDLGWSAEDAAVSVREHLTAAIEALRGSFIDDLIRKVNELAGGEWINQLTDLVNEVAQLRTDAAALGVETTLIDEYFVRAAQALINKSQLTGDAFSAVQRTLGPLGIGLREFSEAAEDVAQAIKRSAQEVASAIQSYQDQLFLAQQNSQTLAGALAIFDLQAQRAREAEIAAGGEALVSLEALQAQQRINIIADFNARALEEEKRRQEEETRAKQQAADEQRRLLEEAQRFLEGEARRIQEFISNLLAGSQSPLSPAARLASAQGTFSSQYSSALGGNRDALSGITSNASNVLEAAKALYGSSSAYQTIFNQIIGQLQALPAQLSAEQFIVDNLTPPLTSITDAVDEQTNANALAQSALIQAINSGNASAIATALSTYFSTLDTTMDNAIDFNEMKNALGFSYTTGRLKDIFNELDNNGNGLLERTELIGDVKDNTNPLKTTALSTPFGQLVNAVTGPGGTNFFLNQVATNLGGTLRNPASDIETIKGFLNTGGVANGLAATFSALIGNASAPTSVLGELERVRANLVSQNAQWGASVAPGGSVYLATGVPGITYYALGGPIDGPSHAFGGKNINVEGGEYIINKRDTARNRALLDAINFGHGAPVANDNRDLISRLDRLERRLVAATLASGEMVAGGVAEIVGEQRELNKRMRRPAA